MKNLNTICNPEGWGNRATRETITSFNINDRKEEKPETICEAFNKYLSSIINTK
jgi:hypothetical protein